MLCSAGDGAVLMRMRMLCCADAMLLPMLMRKLLLCYADADADALPTRMLLLMLC